MSNPKDFQKQILETYYKQSQKYDPYVFVTPEVSQYMSLLSMVMTTKFILKFMVSTAIVSPLQNVVTSLQLSVLKHKDIYQSQEARSKELARLNTEMTVHDKRKFQLMIRAGGKTVPYVAPVYGGYREAYQGLKSQGWRAFYKGLTYRLATNALYLFPFVSNSILIDQTDIKQGVLYQNLKTLGSCMLIDLFINPIYLLQNRHVLQNRLPQFRVISKPYKSFSRAIRYGQAFKGLGFHLVNNFTGFFTRFPLYLTIIPGEPVSGILYAYYLVGEIITYPFSTAYKRLLCQTERSAGMIPVRYSGLIHAIKVIAYQEGPKGLWRAFPLHAGLNLFKLKLVEILCRNNQIKQ